MLSERKNRAHIPVIRKQGKLLMQNMKQKPLNAFPLSFQKDTKPTSRPTQNRGAKA